ncbi:MAG: hypothetical protein WCA11_05785, partial [Terracidiphilus sp.]
MFSLRHGVQPARHFIETFHRLDRANMAGRNLEGDNVGPEICPRHWRFATMWRYRLGLNEVTVISQDPIRKPPPSSGIRLIFCPDRIWRGTPLRFKVSVQC